VKQIQAPVAIEAVDLLEGRVRVWNKYHTLSLAHLDIHWELTEDGSSLQSGNLPPVDLAAGTKGELIIPFQLPTAVPPDVEYHLKISFRLAEETSWAAKGHEVVWAQFPLPFQVPPKRILPLMDLPDIQVNEDEHNVTLRGPDFEAVFSKADGLLTAYRSQGRDLIQAGPYENYFRAPTDIDLLCGNPPASIHKWRAAGLDRLERRLISLEVIPYNAKMIAVHVVSRLNAPDVMEGIESEVTYHVYGNGEITINNTVSIDERLPYVPRVGVEMIVPAGMETITWYGRGTHENYVDRKHGAAVGRYQSTVTEQFTPYVYPSECGGKEDTRWLALTDSNGNGLLVVAFDKLHFDALHHTIRDLAEAKHIVALPPREEIILHLDGWHMGVGGDDGWLSQVHPEFLLFPGIYRFAYKIKPLTSEDDPGAIARLKIEGEF
jgi:beta-galactosidase